MVRRIIICTFCATTFLSCDADFKQGKCDEGFFEQNNFEGGSYCVPLGDTESVKAAVLDTEKLNKTDIDELER
ncbi:hypothetical protein Celal_3209 [Cellulophaga algicola DSM 14237]|uniref:Lipoprotein n=1 Tax=Cellulophaga algicola (strain DSM 14237 / IC166 / ACAM 630) TaxID=688270 RepID=E6X4Y8_CELAD|nr:hypothetical protein [Cellulophaga algicola]ADV50480.1 hypothetical protein Celal_3209 [Cellulophaga algicola DSM 14237]